MDVITPESDPKDLAALETAALKHPTGIPNELIARKHWKVEHKAECQTWFTFSDGELSHIKDSAVKEIDNLFVTKNSEMAKHEAMDAISEMMTLQMKLCGGVIKPPFYLYQGPEVQEESAQTTRTRHKIANLFKNKCEASKKANLIHLVHMYVSHAFKWTIGNAMKTFTSVDKHMKAQTDIISNFQVPLHTALQGYCSIRLRPDNEINIEDDLENCFNEYKKRTRQTINVFSSTIRAVCGILFFF